MPESPSRRLAGSGSTYDSALKTAFEYSDQVLIEEYIELGREVRCGIIVKDGKLRCLPWFLEAGLYCSFSNTGSFAPMIKASGISVSELLMTAINETLNP